MNKKTNNMDMNEIAYSVVKAATGEDKDRVGAGRAQLGGGMKVAASTGKPNRGGPGKPAKKQSK